MLRLHEEILIRKQTNEFLIALSKNELSQFNIVSCSIKGINVNEIHHINIQKNEQLVEVKDNQITNYVAIIGSLPRLTQPTKFVISLEFINDDLIPQLNTIRINDYDDNALLFETILLKSKGFID
ncbi:hypothetical protein OPW41_12180 [Vibrio europaeus]|uniref:hypothetical protein n=1 Tax=Vibrio europaeus TaxID=300876 RepID=UPI00233E9B0F|nr:hypothetical protein [Vibrio europaeus]MDC5721888.1 hypothetical protein [Vibrio europaeus]MDC5758276.1 hypothetical protein [Vibrio europaeus]MDC5776552.1 hypothetical protein [Vibrio europaeus]MDC5795589.1 hypothetical protein [Vibrio europaeus]MDC5801532.1 hypothetical protein [Vibrio europaeus]